MWHFPSKSTRGDCLLPPAHRVGSTPKYPEKCRNKGSCMWISCVCKLHVNFFGTSPKWTLFCRRGKDRAWRNFCPFCEILYICKLRHHRRSASFQKSLHCFPLKKKHKAYDGNNALHSFSTKNQNLASRHIGCAVHQHGMVAQKHQWTIARD